MVVTREMEITMARGRFLQNVTIKIEQKFSKILIKFNLCGSLISSVRKFR
jgi:hypothetical protein